MGIALIVIFVGVSSAAFGLYYINPEAQAAPSTLTIMTYNVHQGEDKLGSLIHFGRESDGTVVLVNDAVDNGKAPATSRI